MVPLSLETDIFCLEDFEKAALSRAAYKPVADSSISFVCDFLIYLNSFHSNIQGTIESEIVTNPSRILISGYPMNLWVIYLVKLLP
jgi:hypothetical protein